MDVDRSIDELNLVSEQSKNLTYHTYPTKMKLGKLYLT